TSPYLARAYEPVPLTAYPSWPALAFVMEFFPINLSQLRARCRDTGFRFSGEQVVAWARQLAEGLMHLHDRHQLVHRDIKPSNVMFRIASNGILANNLEILSGAEAVLTDFGTVARNGTEERLRVVCRNGVDLFKHADFYPPKEQPRPQQCVPEMDIDAFGGI